MIVSTNIENSLANEFIRLNKEIERLREGLQRIASMDKNEHELYEAQSIAEEILGAD